MTILLSGTSSESRLQDMWARLLDGVPLPAGAAYADDWDGRIPQRVVFGPRHCVVGHRTAFVQTSCVQDASGGIREAMVTVDGADQNGLTGVQAQDLATLLDAAADQIGAWKAAAKAIGAGR
jgi:hypothetical protein